MNRSALLDRIADVIATGRAHPLGVAGIMIDAETAAGRTVVPVGSVTPFAVPVEDWVAPTVIAVDGGEVRIIAILAKCQGNGAFRRLVESIQAAGLSPVVVEPVGLVMPAILKHWGWTGRTIGRGFERFEEWRPRQRQINASRKHSRRAPETVSGSTVTHQILSNIGKTHDR